MKCGQCEEPMLKGIHTCGKDCGENHCWCGKCKPKKACNCKEEFKKLVEGVRKKLLKNFKDYYDKYSWSGGYNQALTDILEKLNEKLWNVRDAIQN